MTHTIKQDLRRILTSEDMAEAYAIARAEKELDPGSELYQQLYGYYLEHHADRAPYATWKMRHDSGPDIDTLISEWLVDDLGER